jgi:hypothetical protein
MYWPTCLYIGLHVNLYRPICTCVLAFTLMCIGLHVHMYCLHVSTCVLAYMFIYWLTCTYVLAYMLIYWPTCTFVLVFAYMFGQHYMGIAYYMYTCFGLHVHVHCPTCTCVLAYSSFNIRLLHLVCSGKSLWRKIGFKTQHSVATAHQGCQIFLVTGYHKQEKMYQMNTKCTKWS